MVSLVLLEDMTIAKRMKNRFFKIYQCSK